MEPFDMPDLFHESLHARHNCAAAPPLAQPAEKKGDQKTPLFQIVSD